ncbi:hypothetical protein ACQKWADRAFT_283206 [Trichoderma austrokoningii]
MSNNRRHKLACNIFFLLFVPVYDFASMLLKCLEPPWIQVFTLFLSFFLSLYRYI